MQRIDENTFIDDTLVTCAEYQLFIDEMREQGKYYQPDHWTSYQFPEGQAREPILGVRMNDAKVFCEWLSHKEEGEFDFRIPTWHEATTHPNISTSKPHLGNWLLVNRNDEYRFLWCDAISLSTDVRNLNRGRLITSLTKSAFIRESELKDQFAFLLDQAISRAQAQPQDIARVHDLQLDLDFGVDRGVGAALNRDLSMTIDRGGKLVKAEENELLQEFDHKMFAPVELKRRQEQDKNWNLGIHRHTILDTALVVAANSTIRISHNRSVSRRLSRKHNLDRNFLIDVAFDLMVDLYTLQERIAGRSPAFEGIRLVKERIR